MNDKLIELVSQQSSSARVNFHCQLAFRSVNHQQCRCEHIDRIKAAPMSLIFRHRTQCCPLHVQQWPLVTFVNHFICSQKHNAPCYGSKWNALFQFREASIRGSSSIKVSDFFSHFSVRKSFSTLGAIIKLRLGNEQLTSQAKLIILNSLTEQLPDKKRSGPADALSAQRKRTHS